MPADETKYSGRCEGLGQSLASIKCRHPSDQRRADAGSPADRKDKMPEAMKTLLHVLESPKLNVVRPMIRK
jgi:hypothetical protein